MLKDGYGYIAAGQGRYSEPADYNNTPDSPDRGRSREHLGRQAQAQPARHQDAQQPIFQLHRHQTCES